MLRNSVKALLAACVLFGAPGCVSEVDEFADCLDVCDAYDECIGGDFDSTGCADACEDRSDFSDSFETQVDMCEDCLEIVACSPGCNNVCSGVIPEL